jgi:hypothetical protein
MKWPFLEAQKHPNAFPRLHEWIDGLYAKYQKRFPHGTVREFVAIIECGEIEVITGDEECQSVQS